MIFETCDVLIIGSGIAGLTLALKLPRHLKVIVLSKASTTMTASYYAQGGIAAVHDRSDDIAHHVADSLQAAAGLGNLDAVTLAVSEADACIQWLQSQGVTFNVNSNGLLHLLQEGGHSHARIVHAEDATGKYVMQALQTALLQRPNTVVYENTIAIDLIKHHEQCYGVDVFSINEQTKKSIFAKTTVLATGGASGVFQNTTNGTLALGDGIAMAWRAGCNVANMEFVQFHPTCLYDPVNPPFLISEAVRGHGGWLRTFAGERFMPSYDPRAELATRDIVAKAIYLEMQKAPSPHVYLDLTHLDANEIQHQFPTIYRVCLQRNIDITQQKIPVMPAAHYTCGGIVTDMFARTYLERLYAVGEVACTGLHGANRLASNSLLEAVVFAERAAQHISMNISQYQNQEKMLNLLLPPKQSNDFKPLLNSLRQLMWEKVGIVRDKENLSQAHVTITNLKFEFNRLNAALNESMIMYRNALDVAELIIKAALQRKESRGCHFRKDYPFKNECFEKNTVFVESRVDVVEM